VVSEEFAAPIFMTGNLLRRNLQPLFSYKVVYDESVSTVLKVEIVSQELTASVFRIEINDLYD
jgi:hypothetical protein